MKNISIILLVIWTSACAANSGPQYYYNEIVVLNRSDKPVNEVSVSITSTKALFSCSYIAPSGECSNIFRKRKYLGNPITISWTYQSNLNTTREFVLNLPTDLHADTPFRGVLEITKGGMIKHYIEQNKN